MIYAKADADAGAFDLIALTHADLDILRKSTRIIQFPPPPAHPIVMLFAAVDEDAIIAILGESVPILNAEDLSGNSTTLPGQAKVPKPRRRPPGPRLDPPV